MAAPPHQAAISGDFINDIIIVCTLAIVIGQNLRADLKEAVEIKRREIREYVRELPKSTEITTRENIRSLYDYIKNFSVCNLIRYMAFFYICIIASVLLDLIGLNEHTKQIDFWQQFPIDNVRFWFELFVWGSLFIYGFKLIHMHMRYNVFNQKSYNLITGLELIKTGLSIAQEHDS